MKSFNLRLETFSNFAIIAVALLILGFVIKNYFSEKKAPVAHRVIAKGTRISWPQIDFSKNGKTVAVVLQSGCKFCLESKPFYQKLAATVSQTGKAKLVILLSDLMPEGNSYLSENGFPQENVVLVSFKKLGISATPYLFVADQAGVVIASWLGKLNPNEEKEVLSMVE